MAGHRASTAALVAGGLPDRAARPRGWLGPGLLPVGLRLARMGARAASRGCRRSIIDRRPGGAGAPGGTAPRSGTRGIAATGAHAHRPDQCPDSQEARLRPRRRHLSQHRSRSSSTTARGTPCPRSSWRRSWKPTASTWPTSGRSGSTSSGRASATSSTATGPRASVWSRPSTRFAKAPDRAPDRATDFTAFSPKPRPGNVEVWLSGRRRGGTSRRKGPPRQPIRHPTLN